MYMKAILGAGCVNEGLYYLRAYHALKIQQGAIRYDKKECLVKAFLD